MRLTKVGRLISTTVVVAGGLVAMADQAPPLVQIFWVIFCIMATIMLHMRAIKIAQGGHNRSALTALMPLLFVVAAGIAISKSVFGIAVLIFMAGILTMVISLTDATQE